MHGTFVVCAIMQACVYVCYNLFIITMIFALNFMVAAEFSREMKSPSSKAKTGAKFQNGSSVGSKFIIFIRYLLHKGGSWSLRRLQTSVKWSCQKIQGNFDQGTFFQI